MKYATIDSTNIEISPNGKAVKFKSSELTAVLIKNKNSDIETPYGNVNVDDIVVSPDGEIIFTDPKFALEVDEKFKKTGMTELNIGYCQSNNIVC